MLNLLWSSFKNSAKNINYVSDKWLTITTHSWNDWYFQKVPSRLGSYGRSVVTYIFDTFGRALRAGRHEIQHVVILHLSNEVKLALIKSVFKGKSKLGVCNYRPISVLLILSKVLKKRIWNYYLFPHKKFLKRK